MMMMMMMMMMSAKSERPGRHVKVLLELKLIWSDTYCILGYGLRRLVNPYRRFGTTCRSHLQGSRNFGLLVP